MSLLELMTTINTLAILGILWELRKMEQILTQAVMKMVMHDHDVEALKKQAHSH